MVGKPLVDAFELLAKAQEADGDDVRALLEKALPLLEQARLSGDDPLAVQLALGRVLLGLGRWDQARLSFKRALAADEPSAPEARIAFDDARRVVGVEEDWRGWAADRMEESLVHLDAGAEWRAWGDYVVGRGHSGRAIHAYERAVSVNPEDREAWLAGGDLLSEMQSPHQALEWYGGAIGAAERGPDQESQVANAKIRAGSVLLELSRHEQALVEAEDVMALVRRLSERVHAQVAESGATELAPDVAAELRTFDKGVASLLGWAAYVAGWACYGLRRYREAAEYFESARPPEIETRLKLFSLQASIAVAERRGLYADAWKLLTWTPDIGWEHFWSDEKRWLDFEYLDTYAALLRARGDWETAKDLYETASRFVPDPGRVWLPLMMLYLERRDQDPRDADNWLASARDRFDPLRKQLESRLQHSKETQDQEDLDVLWRQVKYLLSLGPLLVEMRQFAEARPYLVDAIRISTNAGFGSELTAVGHAYLGLAEAGTTDYQAATASLARALEYDPSNLDYKQRLADLLQQVELFDRAERLYRDVIEAAPDNVDAHIGLAELLTGLGAAQGSTDKDSRGEADNPELYREARDHLEKALRIAKETGSKGTQFRTGSRSLTPPEQAALHYHTGYALVKLHQAGAKRNPLLRPRLPLAQARRAFRRARDCDPNHFKAKRALGQLEDVKGSAASDLGGLIVAGLTTIILVTVQLAFYFKGFPDSSNEIHSNPTVYASLTFGLLGILIAAISLPELLKLRVGGVQLEKKATEHVDVLANVSIARDQSFTARFARRLGTPRPISPDIGGGRESKDPGVIELRRKPGGHQAPAKDAKRASKLRPDGDEVPS